MCTDRRAGRQRGITLVELIMFIVIVSVALVGVLQVMRFTTANSADPLRRKQALMIAEGLLEEVELAKFTYCDVTDDSAPTAASTAACTIGESFGQVAPEPVGARPYDNVNDYVGAANVPTLAFNNGAGQLADANGVAMQLTGYSVLLTITPETLGGIAAGGTSADSNVLRISVEVSYDGQKLVLDGYRTRYAPNAL